MGLRDVLAPKAEKGGEKPPEGNPDDTEVLDDEVCPFACTVLFSDQNQQSHTSWSAQKHAVCTYTAVATRNGP